MPNIPPDALRLVGMPEDLEVPVTAEHQRMADESRARADAGSIVPTAQGHALAEHFRAKYPPLEAALRTAIKKMPPG